jgi:hypothetical protein
MRVREHAGLEVARHQSRQDADRDGPPTVSRRGAVDGGERIRQLGGERPEGPSRERDGTSVDLEVEAIELERDARVDRCRQHRAVHGQRPAGVVDDGQLELRAERGGAGAESGAREHTGHRLQALPRAAR